MSTANQVPLVSILSVAFALISSPVFGVSLIVLAVGYVIFIPAESLPLRSVKVANIVAWTACGLSFLAIWTILMVGMFAEPLGAKLSENNFSTLLAQNLKLESELQSATSQLTAIQTPWRITAEQERKLDLELSKPNIIYPSAVIGSQIGSTDSQAYANQLTDILKRRGYRGLWSAGSVGPDVKGLVIGISPNIRANHEPIPPAMIAFAQILTRAGIPFSVGEAGGDLKETDFELDVGGKP